MALSAGDRLGSYEILSPIGAGGMGEVYRAVDTRLGREVAIKILPAEMAADGDRLARFHREARAVAALNHPGVVTLYSVEESGGVHFLSMELVDGEPLQKLIPAEGFAAERVIELATALAEAVAAAHAKGLVHRDLKPANIMITPSGRVKVLDFGLAKDIRTAGPSDETVTTFDQTQAGVVMGTPPYMSPEQISGAAVDHRTDIFSIGIILYEMLTGRRPFQGRTQVELAASILRDPMPAIAKPDVPAGLIQVVEKCLAKVAADRMASAGDLANGLRQSGATRAMNVAAVSHASDDAFWVAVAPFKFTGVAGDLEALAEGLTEEIIGGLSRFSYLRVLTKGTAGARYILEGSLRQAGTQLRLAMKLIDARTGTNLWAENYTRPFAADNIFEIQDDLVPIIVATVGETNGILTHSMWTSLRDRDPATLTPYEAMLRSFGALEQLSDTELNLARSYLARAIDLEPNHSTCLAMLSAVNSHSYGMGLVPPNSQPLEAALLYARLAVASENSNGLAHHALALAHFFRKEAAPFHTAMERALSLNEMDGYTRGSLGLRVAFMGNWQQGCLLTGQAMRLNPRHPGWYWFPQALGAYRRGEFQKALEFQLRVNLPNFAWHLAILAAIHGQLGNDAEARKAVNDLLRVKPDFEPQELDRYFWEPEMMELWMDGCRKAGLVAGPPLAAAKQSSTETRADDGFWVAVLPFRTSSAVTEAHALADGLTEEITTALSRFPYLRVIARGSANKHSSEGADIRTIGDQLGARYVLEGSLRQAGGRLRASVQLVDASTGAQLWAETYERPFTGDAIFELQDDLVPRIVATVASVTGVLSRAISHAARSKPLDGLSPYESLMRCFTYWERQTPGEHATVRDELELAIDKHPAEATIHAALAMVYLDEYRMDYNVRPNSLDRARKHAQISVDLAPSNYLAHYVLATVHFFQGDRIAFRQESDASLRLNSLDQAITGFQAHLIFYTGDWDGGVALWKHCSEWTASPPPWLPFLPYLDAYRRQDYSAALTALRRANLQGSHRYHSFLAAVYGQLGDRERAAEAVAQLLRLAPGYNARAEHAKSMHGEFLEHFLDGLRKAGLDIGDSKPASSPLPSTPPASRHSIAVLPFANMSADKDQEYFSDGLAEEIINLLAQGAGLKVIARTSSFAFRGKEQDIRQIAEALDVTHVLEGSVRRAGNRIRITAQLIQAVDGSHLWSERYDRELSDIFAVQDEIAAAITSTLKIKLLPTAGSQRYNPSLPAYEAYLKAKYYEGKVTPEAMELNKGFYETAIALDPGFALAHVGLGHYWIMQTIFGRRSASETVPPARTAIRRALEIDGSLPEAHAALGHIAAFYDLDWATSDRHFEIPGAKQAGFVLTPKAYGAVQFIRGNPSLAIKVAEPTIAANPLEVWPRMNMHAYLQAAGREEEAFRHLERVLELDENQVVALVSKAMMHADRGEVSEALRTARRAYAVGPWFPDSIAVLAALLRRGGEEAESKKLVQQLGSGDTLGDDRAHAIFHLLCGEIDEGADWAEKAIARRDHSMMYYLRFVVCKGLRASSRWPKIAEVLKLPNHSITGFGH